GFGECAVERAWDFENGGFESAAIGLDRRLLDLLAAASCELGQPRRIQPPCPASLVPPAASPGCTILRQRSRCDLQFVAVVRPSLSCERFDAQEVIAGACETMDEVRVGGPAEYPHWLVVVCDPLQALRVKPASGALINRKRWV